MIALLAIEDADILLGKRVARLGSDQLIFEREGFIFLDQSLALPVIIAAELVGPQRIAELGGLAEERKRLGLVLGVTRTGGQDHRARYGRRSLVLCD